MPATPDTADTASRTIAFRVSVRLERELEALAQGSRPGFFAVDEREDVWLTPLDCRQVGICQLRPRERTRVSTAAEG